MSRRRRSAAALCNGVPAFDPAGISTYAYWRVMALFTDPVCMRPVPPSEVFWVTLRALDDAFAAIETELDLRVDGRGGRPQAASLRAGPDTP